MVFIPDAKPSSLFGLPQKQATIANHAQKKWRNLVNNAVFANGRQLVLTIPRNHRHCYLLLMRPSETSRYCHEAML